MTERLYTTHQVADLVGATPAKVIEWMQKGWLPYKRLPDGPVRISEKGLIQFLKDRGVDPVGMFAQPEGAYVPSDPPSDDGHATIAVPDEPAAFAVEPPSVQQTPPVEQVPIVGEAPIPDEVSTTDEPPTPEETPDEVPTADETPDPLAPGEDTGGNTSAPNANEVPAPVADEAPIADTAPVADEAPEPAVQPTPLSALLHEVVRLGATAVQVLPGRAVRVRIDGGMVPLAGFEDPATLLTEAECLAGLAPSAGGLQAGQFSFQIDGRSIDVRVHSMPAVQGPSAVLHVHDPARPSGELADLGLAGADALAVRALLRGGEGLVLVAGPVRHGGPRALWTLGAECARSDALVAVVDAGPEPRVMGACQLAPQPVDGLDTAEALRALGEMDADVLIASRLPDRAAVTQALLAGAEGRLVVAGLAGPDAGESLAALAELHGDPVALAEGLRVVVFCRSVRRLCPRCRCEQAVGAEALDLAHLPADAVDFPVYRPVGCERCGQSGYVGRCLLTAVARVAGSLRCEVCESADAQRLAAAVQSALEQSLLDAAVRRLRAGEVALEDLAL